MELVTTTNLGFSVSQHNHQGELTYDGAGNLIDAKSNTINKFDLLTDVHWKELTRDSYFHVNFHLILQVKYNKLIFISVGGMARHIYCVLNLMEGTKEVSSLYSLESFVIFFTRGGRGVQMHVADVKKYQVYSKELQNSEKWLTNRLRIIFINILHQEQIGEDLKLLPRVLFDMICEYLHSEIKIISCKNNELCFSTN